MAGYNHCTFIGNVGRDPDLKYTPNGTAVCNTAIAVTEKYKGEENTTWVNVVFWGKLAEVFAEYVQKGRSILVAGRLQNRQWEDRDGNKRTTTEIVASAMQMLGGSGGQKQESATYPQPGDEPDIPF